MKDSNSPFSFNSYHIEFPFLLLYVTLHYILVLIILYSISYAGIHLSS